MSADLRSLIPELQEPARALENLAVRAGVAPRITSTLRSRAEQTRLYRRFLAGQNPYPVAPPGTSAHEYGYAFDMVVIGAENQADLGTVWKQWGGVYGGKADPVHFEYPGFSPPRAEAPISQGCSGLTKGLLEAVDFVLGFAPYIGPVELASWLLSFGFPKSTVLEWLQNPVTSSVCGTS